MTSDRVADSATAFAPKPPLPLPPPSNDSEPAAEHFHVGAAESATPTSMSEEIMMSDEVHMSKMPKSTHQ